MPFEWPRYYHVTARAAGAPLSAWGRAYHAPRAISRTVGRRESCEAAQDALESGT